MSLSPRYECFCVEIMSSKESLVVPQVVYYHFSLLLINMMKKKQTCNSIATTRHYRDLNFNSPSVFVFFPPRSRLPLLFYSYLARGLGDDHRKTTPEARFMHYMQVLKIYGVALYIYFEVYDCRYALELVILCFHHYVDYAPPHPPQPSVSNTIDVPSHDMSRSCTRVCNRLSPEGFQ